MLAVQEIAVVIALLAWGYFAQGLLAAFELFGLIVLFYVATTVFVAVAGRLLWDLCELAGVRDDPLNARRATVFEFGRPLAAICLVALVNLIVRVWGLNPIFRIILAVWLAYMSFASRRSRKILGLRNVEAAFVGEFVVYVLAIVYFSMADSLVLH